MSPLIKFGVQLLSNSRLGRQLANRQGNAVGDISWGDMLLLSMVLRFCGLAQEHPGRIINRLAIKKRFQCIGNQIDAAMIFTRADFVNVL
jgi:hypothetical protein